MMIVVERAQPDQVMPRALQLHAPRPHDGREIRLPLDPLQLRLRDQRHRPASVPPRGVKPGIEDFDMPKR